MGCVDHHAVEKSVYDLANSSDPIASQVREALEVIESALDTFKYVSYSPFPLEIKSTQRS